MRIAPGQTVVLTGASGGMGVVIAERFAEMGVNLALLAHPGSGLDRLVQAASRSGSRAKAWASDLRNPDERRDTIAGIRQHFGGIDLLINNAGVEYNSYYHELTEEQISEVVTVNLEAAMLMTWLVLPGMLERGAGHVVHISSLAGKAGPAFQEPYAATKAGLIAFSAAFRASYRGTGVGSSVIVPGFVEAGIYTRLKARSGIAAPRVLVGSTPEQVASAIVRAVNRNLPEVIVNRYPIRPLAAVYALWPRIGDWMITRLGVHEFFRRVVEAEKKHSGATRPDYSPSGLVDIDRK